MKYDRLGVGKIFDVLSCIVHEELNGDYSLEFKYPITGAARPYMTVGYTVMAVCPRYVPTSYLPTWATVDGEMFDIYSVSLPIDGVLTVKCRHVSRRLSNSVCSQTRIQTQAPQTIVNSFAIPNPTIAGQIMFQLLPDSAPSKTFEVYTLKSVLARIIGSEGSLVTNGCDVGFNCHTNASYNASRGLLVDTYITSHRGTDRGAEVRYGINMTNIDQTEDNTGTFNAYVPFWKADEYSTPISVASVVQPTTPITPVVAVPLDLSTVFESQPTTAQMEAYARELLDSTMPWIGSDTLTVDFINGTEIDPHGAPISLGDTVHVYWGDAKIAKPMRVVAYDYDVLAEKYIKLELGTQETEFVATTEDFSGMSASGGGGGGGGSEGVVLKEITFPTNWHDTGNGYHTCTPTIAGGHSPSWKIDLQPTEAQLVQLKTDGVDAIYVKNNTGTLTAYAVGSAPTEGMTMQCTVSMTDSLTGVLGDTVGVGNTLSITEITLPLSWSDSGNGYHTATPTVTGTIPTSAKIDLQPTEAQTRQLQSDGVTALYVENNAGTLTAYAVGNAPSVALTMQCSVEVTDALSTVLGDTFGVSGDATICGYKVLVTSYTFRWQNSANSNPAAISTITGGLVNSSNFVLVVGNGSGGLLVLGTDAARNNMFCALANRTSGFTGNINVQLIFLYT